MNKNNTMKEICEALARADTVLIFPHISMDGDTLGSSIALCKGFRGLGKTAHVLIEEEIPEYLKFIDDGSCTFDLDVISEPDLCICVDCAHIERFIHRKDKFFEGKVTMCIDHHRTSECFADFNHIDHSAAATGEIVFNVLNEMGVAIDKGIGEAIYAAIITDTGNFQYSNTSVNSHLITAELFNLGIDHSYVCMMLYQNDRIEKLHISGKILGTIKMMAQGKAAMAYVTRDMLERAGALMTDTEGTSEILRNISGVELSLFAKETQFDETKFSIRSKTWVDVSEISMKYKGGGHKRAGGFTIKKPAFEAIKMIEADIEEYFASHSGENDN
ncbi:MAG: bifunctional oligoribonuclease/PAP phosphatase NrnA [Clostridiales bacterium]|nr:bifunctional oligoribonuclease/PAP phosphatase NrnA [Clostridiales bacterium]